MKLAPASAIIALTLASASARAAVWTDDFSSYGSGSPPAVLADNYATTFTDSTALSATVSNGALVFDAPAGSAAAGKRATLVRSAGVTEFGVGQPFTASVNVTAAGGNTATVPEGIAFGHILRIGFYAADSASTFQVNRTVYLEVRSTAQATQSPNFSLPTVGVWANNGSTAALQNSTATIPSFKGQFQLVLTPQAGGAVNYDVFASSAITVSNPTGKVLSAALTTVPTVSPEFGVDGLLDFATGAGTAQRTATVDNLAFVPEPHLGSAAGLAVAAAGLGRRRRRA